jgi:hypothetical protein
MLVKLSEFQIVVIGFVFAVILIIPAMNTVEVPTIVVIGIRKRF